MQSDPAAPLAARLQVNGRSIEAQAPAATLLLDYLRDTLRLTGTHQGCDTAQCGACTVLVDGIATKSCNLLLAQVDGCTIATIEGLEASDGTLHPMQQAFGRHHGLQCGYCTPGMVMRAVAMAQEDVPAEPSCVRRALSGNLCRCTGYQGIVDAVCEGLQQMRSAAAPSAPSAHSVPATPTTPTTPVTTLHPAQAET